VARQDGRATVTTAVRLKGLKRYRHPKTGRTYIYHRASGTRIYSEFGSPEFFAELAALNAATRQAPKAVPGSLGLLIDEFVRSPHWGTLSAATRRSYERVFAILKPIKDMPVIQADRAFLFRLRDDKIYPKHGVWLANYTLTTLSVVLKFAHDRGCLPSNPLAEKVRKIRNSRRGGANRPWSEQECRIVMERAPPHLKLPLALAMCAGLRKADFLKVTLSAIKDGTIAIRTSKRGVRIAIPIHPILQEAIEARPKSDALQIAVTSRGEPWTESGFNASFAKFKKKLEQEGLIEPGLTPHGLRHTLGTRLREAGADDRTIADVLGQKSTSMARHYSENASLPESAQALVSNLDLIEKKR
jgi:integrase